MATTIDLQKDMTRITRYISRRCNEFPEYVNAGPGKDEDAIRLITLGFSFEQSGWIALVFDTRPKAAFDGKWQNYIEENAEAYPVWSETMNKMLEGHKLSVTLPNGKRRSFPADSDFDELAACFGEACREVLVQAKAKGKFRKLPLSPNCRLAVEEHEGRFGWVEGEQKISEVLNDRKMIFERMKQDAKQLSKDAQVGYWIKQLDRFAAAQVYGYAIDCDLSDGILRELSKNAKQSTLPLLEWANRWSEKPELKPLNQRKEGEKSWHPHQDRLCSVFRELAKWGVMTPDVETMTRKYIATATQVPPVAGKHGIGPWHAARLLAARFTGYPEPKVHESTNQLLNAKNFCGKK